MPLKGDLDDEDEFSGDDYPPRPGDLPADQQAILKAIKSPRQIKDCHVMNTWVDDHILCAEVVINGIQFAAWWVGWPVVGALTYADSKKAWPVIMEFLKGIDWEPSEPDEDEDEVTEEDLPR